MLHGRSKVQTDVRDEACNRIPVELRLYDGQFIPVLVITDFSNNEKEHNDDEFLEARQEKHWPGA